MNFFKDIKEKQKYEKFGPAPDIAVCSNCDGRFHYTECYKELESESWEMPEEYWVYYCPVCEDGGMIDDWFYSNEQQKKYDEWEKENID